eukprot:TRINITY_DN22568_c0_g1_i1.p1 TRINITY_DN22568_c0_g1~~TRINITY_DN22568_c0_g1_i1.p1  ORF type:complete len:262 (-),score=18.28 TRINITY_DN22568_c0_g1_i1:6-791(-)
MATSAEAIQISDSDSDDRRTDASRTSPSAYRSVRPPSRITFDGFHPAVDPAHVFPSLLDSEWLTDTAIAAILQTIAHRFANIACSPTLVSELLNTSPLTAPTTGTSAHAPASACSDAVQSTCASAATTPSCPRPLSATLRSGQGLGTCARTRVDPPDEPHSTHPRVFHVSGFFYLAPPPTRYGPAAALRRRFRQCLRDLGCDRRRDWVLMPRHTFVGDSNARTAAELERDHWVCLALRGREGFIFDSLHVPLGPEREESIR